MKYIFLFTLLITISNAITTMCYKNNHNDPSTIEKIALNGGECSGKYSLIQMKENGWLIDDMKISMINESMNYIYILKKSANKKVEEIVNVAVPVSDKIDYKELASQMNKEKEKEETISLIQRGKTFYNKTCVNCHGEKGEIVQRGTRKINTLTLEDMKESIYNYEWNEYDRASAQIMKPYAELIVEKDVEAVHKYLQSIK
eukprot:Anaeramoba_flamelloidesa342851_13.p1 GENE.a342851_13~~a342851_13.p1  ORF type:complete len:201 (-),score=13.08 a342851_13:67-669(-)